LQKNSYLEHAIFTLKNGFAAFATRIPPMVYYQTVTAGFYQFAEPVIYRFASHFSNTHRKSCKIRAKKQTGT
jgi:hypothetical protein